MCEPHRTVLVLGLPAHLPTVRGQTRPCKNPLLELPSMLKAMKYFDVALYVFTSERVPHFVNDIPFEENLFTKHMPTICSARDEA